MNVPQPYNCILLPRDSEVIPINPWDELINPLDFTLPTLQAHNDTLGEVKPVEAEKYLHYGACFLAIWKLCLNFQAS